jgi:hypothetical protein
LNGFWNPKGGAVGLARSSMEPGVAICLVAKIFRAPFSFDQWHFKLIFLFSNKQNEKVFNYTQYKSDPRYRTALCRAGSIIKEEKNENSGY